MKHRIVCIFISVSLITVFLGCARGSNKDVLARIDQKYTITLADFNDRISKLPQRYQDAINKNKRVFLDEVIIDIILYNEALRKKLDRDEDVKKVIEEAKRKILIARLLKDEVEDKVTIDDKEVEDYYNANKERFTTPEVLRASHILVKTEEEARGILVELSNGRNFEDLARARSVDPTSKIGGDIGYFTRHQLIPEVEEVCFNMQVGQISDIIKTRFGYHVIKLTEKKESCVKELSEVRDGIEHSLERLKKKLLFNEFVERLKEKSQITINSDLLKTAPEEQSSEN